VRLGAKAAAVVGLLVALRYLAPEHVAPRLGWTEAALEYALAGLWDGLLLVILACLARVYGWPEVAVVLTWPAYESFLQGAARLALPMDRKVAIPPGMNLADVAFGVWTGPVGLTLAGFIVLYLISRLRPWPIL